MVQCIKYMLSKDKDLSSNSQELGIECINVYLQSQLGHSDDEV